MGSIDAICSSCESSFKWQSGEPRLCSVCRTNKMERVVIDGVKEFHKPGCTWPVGEDLFEHNGEAIVSESQMLILISPREIGVWCTYAVYECPGCHETVKGEKYV